MAQIDEIMSSFRAAGHQTLLIRFGPPLRPRTRSAAQFSSACLNNRGCARRAFGHAGRSSTCRGRFQPRRMYRVIHKIWPCERQFASSCPGLLVMLHERSRRRRRSSVRFVYCRCDVRRTLLRLTPAADKGACHHEDHGREQSVCVRGVLGRLVGVTVRGCCLSSDLGCSRPVCLFCCPVLYEWNAALFGA